MKIVTETAKAGAVVTILAGLMLTVATAAAGESAFDLRSPAFTSGAEIPVAYTCSGADRSPALSWTGFPPSTKSFALIVEDPDAPGRTFIHWVAYNMPATTTGLKPGIARGPGLPGGGLQGVNGFGHLGYNGPCPPPGGPHHYHFRLYALDSMLKLEAGADASALKAAMRGHVTARVELVGVFSR